MKIVTDEFLAKVTEVLSGLTDEKEGAHMSREDLCEALGLSKHYLGLVSAMFEENLVEGYVCVRGRFGGIRRAPAPKPPKAPKQRKAKTAGKRRSKGKKGSKAAASEQATEQAASVVEAAAASETASETAAAV